MRVSARMFEASARVSSRATIGQTRQPPGRWLFKPLVFLLCLLPAVRLVWLAYNDALGADPIEALLHGSGDWALRFLLITLALSPLRQWTGWGFWLRYRRMLGLYAYFYALGHFLVWLLLDQALMWETIIPDIVKRPYITVGFTALLLLTPLALTSTKRMMQRLGRRWKKLHRLVYVAAALGVIHFLWLVKADLREPLIYAAILAGLMIWRLPRLRRIRIKQA